MTDPHVAAERERFEEFNDSDNGSGFDLARHAEDHPGLPGEYRDERAQAAWEAWQAAFEAGRRLGDDRLRALTVLVSWEAAEWEYGVRRYGEAQWDPNTPNRQALNAELEKRLALEKP